MIIKNTPTSSCPPLTDFKTLVLLSSFSFPNCFDSWMWQLVHFLVVCSVSWPNCFCLVLFYLFIGSTLKRLCLGKERSSSNYLIFFLTLCSHSLSPWVCMCTFFGILKKRFAVLVENVDTLQIVALLYVCCCFAWLCADMSWLLNFVIACLWNISFISMKVFNVVIIWLLCWQRVYIHAYMWLYTHVPNKTIILDRSHYRLIV